MAMRMFRLLLASFFVFVLINPIFADLNDTCVVQPFPPTCKSYTLPSNEIASNIKMLCNEMTGNMAGCTINNVCTNTASLKYDKYCNSFSVYKDICTDMPMMGCGDYTSMCQNGSVVEQCSTATLTLPDSKTVLPGLINSMCSQMSMPPCSKCVTLSETLSLNFPEFEDRLSEEIGQMMSCDMLTVYSTLCLSMPTMSECAAWNTMCTEIPSWPLCTTKGPNPLPGAVPMVMYFHMGILDYILLESWVPRTTGQYIGALFGVFLAQIFHELLKLVRKKSETHWQRSNYGNPINEEETPILGDKEKKEVIPPFNIVIDVTRALLQALEVAWGLLMMLIAMSFNVGLFIAIFVGSFVGTLIIGRYLYSFNYKPKTSSCH
eukprot:TRINITY_DN734_c0_g1_i1.p1 TRINITY_DN734_c0_g1~~TRINITY_DN734_c0_g1_i1.p1  ORF type:complete len:377 (-),score=56.90 TRINITY_DN734_c0_g1_i1:117-1247(-)